MVTSVGEKKQDVVVIGGGMAGLIAAIEAGAPGVKVTILDKLGPMIGQGIEPWVPGGIGNETSRSAGGGLARFSNTTPIEELLKQHITRGWSRIEASLIRTYLERVAEDCKWLRDDVSLPYDGRFVKGAGPAICRFLYGVVERQGINILFKTKATKLLTDDLGRITGVRARTAKEVTDFKAKAVVMATGGFEGNQEMMIKYVGPDITYQTVLTGCSTNTGDGHLMVLKIGAQLVNLSVCHIRTTDKFFQNGPSRHLRHIYHLGIYINKDCQRFQDEGRVDSDTIANAIVYQPGNKAALIFDEKARAKYPEEYETYPRKEEVIKVAGTIEELATKIEVPPQKLKKLIEEFNGAVRDGKALELPIPKTDKAYKIDTPPFYGFYPVIPGFNHTLGGLKINTKAQALDRENNPIPGLYAAGSIVNWSFGSIYNRAGVRSFKGSYHAGNSSGLATALVFGRMAGRSAAIEAAKSRS